MFKASILSRFFFVRFALHNFRHTLNSISMSIWKLKAYWDGTGGVQSLCSVSPCSVMGVVNNWWPEHCLSELYLIQAKTYSGTMSTSLNHQQISSWACSISQCHTCCWRLEWSPNRSWCYSNCKIILVSFPFTLFSLKESWLILWFPTDELFMSVPSTLEITLVTRRNKADLQET